MQTNSLHKVFFAIVVFFIACICGKLLSERENPVVNQIVDSDPIFKPVAKLHTNQIFNPVYTGTTNPGMINNSNDNGFTMSFHKDFNPSSVQYKTELYLIKLDHDFNIISYNKIHAPPGIFSTPQDPRLFVANKQIYMLYNDNINIANKRDVYITKMSLDDSEIGFKPQHLIFEPFEHKDQKNWTPFVFNEQIYFIYSTDPHIILSWDQKTNKIKKLYNNKTSFAKQWPLGEIRGGTPAIYIKELNAYISFFHSSTRYKKYDKSITGEHHPLSRTYYTGAFLFESKPPFKIIAYTPKPLSYQGQYTGHKKEYNIFFPCGLIEEKNSFLISAGIQDSRAEIFRVSKKELYSKFKYIEKKDLK